MGLALFIDTTIGGFVLGLADPDKLSKGPLWSKLYDERFGAAQYLASSLKEGLDELGAKPTDFSHRCRKRSRFFHWSQDRTFFCYRVIYRKAYEISIAGVSSLGMIGDGLKVLETKKLLSRCEGHQGAWFLFDHRE